MLAAVRKLKIAVLQNASPTLKSSSLPCKPQVSGIALERYALCTLSFRLQPGMLKLWLAACLGPGAAVQWHTFYHAKGHLDRHVIP